MRRAVIRLSRIMMFTLFTVTSVLADNGYRFFYNFAPGSSFFEMEQSRQESGGKLISQFQRTVEFQVSQAPGASLPTLSARIVSLSNKGRRIDYYDGVTFQANISAKGEISGYSFTGGQPKHRFLIQAAGPANKSNIFWMPRFPDTPMNIGDTFAHVVSTGGPGMAADAKIIYELEAVQGHLAQFKLRRSGSLDSVSVSGEEKNAGHAVFDLEKGMWSLIHQRGEGTAHLPGVMSATYKLSSHKEIDSTPCHYTIHAGTPAVRYCLSSQCGMTVSIPYVRISTEGSCPPIEGQYMTEVVTPVALVPPCPVQTRRLGAGCRIGRNGYVTGCIDTFEICGGIGTFPPDVTCKDGIRQQYFIGPRSGPGRRLIAVNYLEFWVTRRTTRRSTDSELVYQEGCTPEFYNEFDPRIRFPP